MSITPPGADMAPITPPGAERSTSPDLWWAVKLRNGAVGFARGPEPPAGSTAATPIGHASSLAELMTHYSAEAIKAIAALGASAKQQAGIVAQTDAGAGQDSTVGSLFIATSGRPLARTPAGAKVSTTPRGDANPINQIPSPIPPSAGNSHLGLPSLTGIAVRVLEAVGGLLLLVLGLRAFLGGESPTVTLARAARTVTP